MPDYELSMHAAYQPAMHVYIDAPHFGDIRLNGCQTMSNRPKCNRRPLSSIWRKYHGRNQTRFSLMATAGRFLPGFTSRFVLPQDRVRDCKTHASQFRDSDPARPTSKQRVEPLITTIRSVRPQPTADILVHGRLVYFARRGRNDPLASRRR